MPLVFWVIAFPLVPVNSPYYDENTRHPQSTCLADLQKSKISRYFENFETCYSGKMV